jgi:hypothetical protein
MVTSAQRRTWTALNKTSAIALVVGCGLALAAHPSFAQSVDGSIQIRIISPDTSGGGSSDLSTLAFVGGTPFLRVRTTWAGISPENRADAVQLRVNGALSVGPVSESDITVGKVQGDWCVLFKGQRFYTADAATARLEGISPRILAKEWCWDARKKLVDLTRPNP